MLVANSRDLFSGSNPAAVEVEFKPSTKPGTFLAEATFPPGSGITVAAARAIAAAIEPRMEIKNRDLAGSIVGPPHGLDRFAIVKDPIGILDQHPDDVQTEIGYSITYRHDGCTIPVVTMSYTPDTQHMHIKKFFLHTPQGVKDSMRDYLHRDELRRDALATPAGRTLGGFAMELVKMLGVSLGALVYTLADTHGDDRDGTPGPIDGLGLRSGRPWGFEGTIAGEYEVAAADFRTTNAVFTALPDSLAQLRLTKQPGRQALRHEEGPARRGFFHNLFH